MEGFNQSQVGEIMDLSQAQISRIQMGIKKKISEYINGKDTSILRIPLLR